MFLLDVVVFFFLFSLCHPPCACGQGSQSCFLYFLGKGKELPIRFAVSTGNGTLDCALIQSTSLLGCS